MTDDRRVPPPAVREPGLKGTLRTFLELVRFEHSIFALPYAYIGALYGAFYAVLEFGEWQQYFREMLARPFSPPVASAYATVETSWTLFVQHPWAAERGAYVPTAAAFFWVTVAMVGARSFAFVVNRAADKEIDARNPRTAGRAVPAGIVKAWELWLFALLVLAAYLFAVFQLAPITHWLWPIPLAAFLVYPYTKRFTPLCHYWLGLCLGLAATGGWAAVGAPLAHPAPWVLGLAVALWTAGFDIIYATQDIDCDKRDGVHSMPADYGIASALKQTRVLHVLTVLLLALAGGLMGAGWAWHLSVVIAATLLWYENSIISADDLSRVNAAFFTTNGIIAVILLVGAVVDVVLG